MGESPEQTNRIMGETIEEQIFEAARIESRKSIYASADKTQRFEEIMEHLFTLHDHLKRSEALCQLKMGGNLKTARMLGQGLLRVYLEKDDYMASPRMMLQIDSGKSFICNIKDPEGTITSQEEPFKLSLYNSYSYYESGEKVREAAELNNNQFVTSLFIGDEAVAAYYDLLEKAQET